MAPSEQSNAEELMSAYLDHELDAKESEEFEAMLASSPEAKEELDDLRQMLQLVSTLPEVEAPPDFYDKVARKIRRRKILEGDLPVFVTLPFQVISVIVVLAIAVVYTMIHLDADPAARLEKDPSAKVKAPEEASAAGEAAEAAEAGEASAGEGSAPQP
ncbi:MAG: zf-HC2 domain-containing protein [Myxococcales bacterium]|nr:zf-HC2 domain-containing protein [Myxococcales bacterium]